MKFLLVIFLFVTSCATELANEYVCGGIAGLKCKDNYICQYDDDSVVDSLGKCVPKITE